MRRRVLLSAALILSLAPNFIASAEEAGPTEKKPKAYLVSNAHLDTQWNWDVQTTISHHVWNTINQNLILLETYPNYIFNFEGGVKYAWMKEYYPREFELMKQYVKEGRWHIAGSSWEASDIIVPSVEASIRNILLGQTFYRDELRSEGTDIFLPDCFGFGWTVPTIASHCGLIGFSSQKLDWRVSPFFPDGRKYPFTIGLWRGVDGSEIMMTHSYDYGRRWNDEDLTHNRLLIERAAKSPLNIVNNYYGTGDIGGSPSITSVKAVDFSHGREGEIEIESATSDQIFKDFLPYADHPELPIYDGELTMDVHGTGCYTSQAAMKLYNRQNELLGDAAERAAMAAELIGGAQYPSDALTESWRRFIYHQFHDDLTGTSIPRAYEFSWNDELLSLKQFANVLENSVAAVASRMDTRVKGIPVVLYNSLGHDVTDVVEFELPAAKCPAKVKVTDAEGKTLKSQITGFNGGKVAVLTEATVPANGFTVVGIEFSGSLKADGKSQTTRELENSLYRLTFDENGDINSLVTKKDGRESVAPGKAIRLAMFRDNESFNWPAWEILKQTVDTEPESFGENVSIKLVENGPLRKTALIEKNDRDSKFRQYVRVYEGALADRIDFYNEVDWANLNSLLKAEFPLTASSPVATYDLGIGTVERGNNIPQAYEVYAQRWADLSDDADGFGLTVMNDCKYGWDKPTDNTLRLTLLHTPKTKDSYKYQDHQDLGHHVFTYSLLPHSGALDKAEASRKADGLNQRVKAFVTTAHDGQLGKSFSLASCDNPSLAVKALKKAESSNEYVVRVYETSGLDKGKGKITFPYAIAKAVKADGTEKTIGEASFEGNSLNVEAGPNGISTYKLTFIEMSQPVAAAATALPLSYDRKCFSHRSFEREADFSDGYSYAAELIPDTLISGSVPFMLQPKAMLNGKVCRGDTIALPKGKYNKVHLLAATAREEGRAAGTFRIGKSERKLVIPSYTGFIGQWGHTGHTKGYLYPDKVAYVGTHRHGSSGDCPYEFTYMFEYELDVPAGASEIVLPDNPEIVVFAATAVSDERPKLTWCSLPYRSAIVNENGNIEVAAESATETRRSLIDISKLTGCSGYVNEIEHPRFLHDGDASTKWCDAHSLPSYVDYDLGSSMPVSGWTITGAGIENQDFITSTCLLQIKENASDEWKTVDHLIGNKRNTVKRNLPSPVNARFVRLLVVQPEQTPEGTATRIYEFAVY